MKRITHYSLLIFFWFILFIAACTTKEADKKFIEDISTFTPKELIRFDHAGDFYFSHLGYSSAALEDGNILIPERQNTALVVVGSKGNLMKLINQGRGPGEILDAYKFVQDNKGRCYTFDQGNGKILILNSKGDFIKEIVPQPFEGSNLSRYFPLSDSISIMEFSSYEHLYDTEKKHNKILIQFNPITETYGKKIELVDIPYARLVLDGNVRGGQKVPYATAQLLTYHPQNKTLLLFHTGTDLIAEVNANFDTLNTISVQLPTEAVSKIESDSIQNSVHYPEQWMTLKPLLPDVKAPASKMMYFNNAIWLKSDLRGKHQKWFVLNMEGEIQQIVQLPKNSMLMHISDHHLGVRLDDVTFALFEPVDL